MRLSRFLRHRGDASKLARLVGVKPMTVYRWRDGASVPRKHHMVRLREATLGKVTEKDFYR